jgi:hypothetical protein
MFACAATSDGWILLLGKQNAHHRDKKKTIIVFILNQNNKVNNLKCKKKVLTYAF